MSFPGPSDPTFLYFFSFIKTPKRIGYMHENYSRRTKGKFSEKTPENRKT